MQIHTKRFIALKKLIISNWRVADLRLKSGEDIFQVISNKKILMVYANIIHESKKYRHMGYDTKGYVEIAVGKNAGTINEPDVFPSDV